MKINYLLKCLFFLTFIIAATAYAEDGGEHEGGGRGGAAPEPTSMLLFAVGASAVGLRRKFSKKNSEVNKSKDA